MNEVEGAQRPSISAFLWSRSALLGLAAFFIAVGWMGSDFGRHWDEHWMVGAWVETVEEQAYRSPRPYPGFYYDLTLPSLVWASGQSSSREVLLDRVKQPSFLINVRKQFVVFTATAIWIAFVLVRRMGRANTEALLAAAVVGFSWQLSYHSRWVASDALLAVLVPASVCLSLEAWRRPERGLRRLGAAVLAGLAMATKYPGGLALLAVLWASAWPRGGPPDRPQAGLRIMSAVGTFTLTFLVFSPHVWLNPRQALTDIQGMMAQYATGHLGHTVQPGLEHALQIGHYLLEVLSPYPLIALAFSLFALVGAAALLRARPVETVLVFSVPLAYWAYFSTQHVMIIRNLLVLTPFAAALVGIGAGALCRLPSELGFRRLLWAVVWLACLFNAIWTLRAAHSIETYELKQSLISLAETIEVSPDQEFRVSKQIGLQWQSSNLTPRSENWQLFEPQDGLEREARVAVLSHQYPVLWFPWPANQRGQYQDLGPSEIDWDFYPGWTGPDRVILMSGDTFKEVRTPRSDEASP